MSALLEYHPRQLLARIDTEWGDFFAAFSPRGLAHLLFPDSPPMPTRDAYPTAAKPRSHWIRQTRTALRQALRGRPILSPPPLDLSSGTPFQQSVWKALQLIPTGTTLTYAELARQIHRPNSARAVGTACGANPIPILIPCHRVLRAGHQLGGFSAGLNWKKRLLAMEKVTWSEPLTPPTPI